MRFFFQLAVLAIPFCSPARADEVQPNADSLQQFGAAAGLCLEWSDGCVVCLRDAAGVGRCSLTGIACQPGPILCMRETPKAAPAVEAPKDPPKDPPK